MFSKGWMPVAVLMASLIWVGCGGGSGNGGAGGEGNSAAASQRPAPQSKQQWIKQASETCAEIQTARKGEIQDFQNKAKEEGGEEPGEGLQLALEQVVFPSMHEQVTKLKAIEAPEGDQAQIEAILAEYSQSLAQLEKRISSGAGIGKNNPFQSYLDKAAAFGLHDCEP